MWEEVAPDAHHGLGQRIIATDAGDVPLMDVRDAGRSARPPPIRQRSGA